MLASYSLHRVSIYTANFFKGAILVRVIILKFKLTHVMILDKKIATMILDWDHQHTVLNDSMSVASFTFIPEVLFKNVSKFSRFQKESKNFFLN